MPARDIHVTPIDEGWVVRKSSKPDPNVYSTQEMAIDAARGIVQRSSSGLIVVHDPDGSVSWREVHGLPAIQKSPVKSDLGTNAIKKAVSAVIRQRLEGQ